MQDRELDCKAWGGEDEQGPRHWEGAHIFCHLRDTYWIKLIFYLLVSESQWLVTVI